MQSLDPDFAAPCFQHICLELDTLQELSKHRSSWFELFGSGKFSFVRHEVPTEIEWDGAHSASFYLFDVNGVEYELSWTNGGVRPKDGRNNT